MSDRTRNLRPTLFQDTRLLDLPELAFRLVTGAAAQADRNGILEYDPRKLALRIAPTKYRAAQGVFDQIVKAGLLKAFKAGGVTYAYFPNWRDEQDPHPNEAPIHPFPPDPEFKLTPPRCLTAQNRKWIDRYPPPLRPKGKEIKGGHESMREQSGTHQKPATRPNPDELSEVTQSVPISNTTVGTAADTGACTDIDTTTSTAADTGACTDIDTTVNQASPSHPSRPPSPSYPSCPSHPSHPTSPSEPSSANDSPPMAGVALDSHARAKLFDLFLERGVKEASARAAAWTNKLSDDQVATVVRHMPELLERVQAPNVKFPSCVLAHRCANGQVLDGLDSIRLRLAKEKGEADYRQSSSKKTKAPVPTRPRTQAEQLVLEPLLASFQEISGLEVYPHWWDMLEVEGGAILAPPNLWLGEELVEAGKAAGVAVTIKIQGEIHLASET